MLTIYGRGGRHCDGVSRRGFLKIGGLAMGGMSLPQLLRAEAQSGVGKSHKGTIMVLLPGGPPHLDMWDLKPEAPAEIRGEFHPIATNVPGIEICELMPRLAANMDKLVPIRSLVGARDDHNLHGCVTGWDTHPAQPGSGEVAGYPPGDRPTIGAVLSKVYGPAVPGVPPSVDLTPVYFDSRFVLSTPPGQAGYLGAAHSAFQVAQVDRSNFTLGGISLERLTNRQALLAALDRFRRSADISGAMEGMDGFARQAMALLTSRRFAAALDVEKEDAATRRRYGIPSAPKAERGGAALLSQFLLARRVIEAGARYVTLAFSRYPFGRMMKGDYNWDWHKDNFSEARAALPMLDEGLAALVEDLHDRGMLDDISVVVWGEFGRTPRINNNAGRDHWPQVAGALLAGGGMRTGQVLGSTNRYGEHAQERPVHIREVFATLYHQLGIDVATTTFPDFSGRPQYLTDHEPIAELV